MNMRNVVAGAILASGSMAVQAAPVQWTSASGGNDHWYEFISVDETWQDAKVAAEGRIFQTLRGYLATVMSNEELEFIRTRVTRTLAWAGGSDESGEGIWRWVTGPEAGQVFFDTNDASATTFAPWAPGEPNDDSGEDYLQLNWDGDGQWNDHGGPGHSGQINGYVVEYGEIFAELPEPGNLALLAASLVGGTIALRRRKL